LFFFVFFYFGLLRAEHKALWNDEIFTQVSSVSHQSYAQHWLGKIGEGNNTPLFYSIQKLFFQLIQYQTPDLWNEQNLYDRLVLRINPIFFMAASIACIFFYFSKTYSLWIGVYSLFISISSFVVWDYWVEARPYTLWIFLTTVHTLHFLNLFRQEVISRKAWIGLTIIHFLLCFSTIFSVAQITIVSALLWLLKERNWKKYILTAIIPTFITLYYFMLAPKYNFWFDLTPDQLIRDCFSRDRFYILFIFTFFLAAYYLGKKNRNSQIFSQQKTIRGNSVFYCYCFDDYGVLLCACTI